MSLSSRLQARCSECSASASKSRTSPSDGSPGAATLSARPISSGALCPPAPPPPLRADCCSQPQPPPNRSVRQGFRASGLIYATPHVSMDHRRRIRSHRARAASRAIPLTVGCSPPECRVAARLRVALRASLSRGSAAAPPQAHADDRGPARVPRGEREAPRVSPRRRVPRVLTILARSRHRLLRSVPRGGGARRPPSWRIAGSVKDASNDDGELIKPRLRVSS